MATDAALARGHGDDAGARRLGRERVLPPSRPGVVVGMPAGGGGCRRLAGRVAQLVQLLAEGYFFGLPHRLEGDLTGRTACGGDRPRDLLDELARSRMAGARNANDDLGAGLVDLDGTDEAELVEAVEKGRVDHGRHGLFDGIVRICHKAGGNRVIRVLGNFASCPSWRRPPVR
jgi:hypothetical protein